MSAPLRRTLLGLRRMISGGMSRSASKNGRAKTVFRQCCTICAKMFDPAITKIEAPVTMSLCSDCKAKLAEGYTACVTKDAFAFVRSAHLKEHGQAGKIIQVSQETFDQIKKLNDEKQNPEPKAKGYGDCTEKLSPKDHKFNLEGMKAGDFFFGCVKCWEQLSKNGVGSRKCGRCGEVMKVLTVTKDDVLDESEAGPIQEA